MKAAPWTPRAMTSRLAAPRRPPRPGAAGAREVAPPDAAIATPPSAPRRRPAPRATARPPAGRPGRPPRRAAIAAVRGRH